MLEEWKAAEDLTAASEAWVAGSCPSLAADCVVCDISEGWVAERGALHRREESLLSSSARGGMGFEQEDQTSGA